MACTPTPNGPCTLAPDGVGCIAPKTEGTFDPIITLLIEGHDDGFTVNWEIITSYPTETATLMYRKTGTNDTVVRVVEVRDTGSITITGLPVNTAYDFKIRPEDTDNYGPWSSGFAITDEDWTSDSETVTHYGEPVFHNGEVVLYS